MSMSSNQVIFAALMSLSAAAEAHTAWLVPAGNTGEWRLQFGGHAGELEPSVPDKLKTVEAVNESGSALEVQRRTDASNVSVIVAGDPAIITLHYDNGIHSTPLTGKTVEKPMTEVAGAVRGVNAQKYGKTIVRWAPIVTKPAGQPFEVSPISNAPARAEVPMSVMVWLDGKPAAGIKVGLSEDEVTATTDSQGVATFIPKAGFNKLWAGKRIEGSSDPRYTQLSYEYALVFDGQDR